MSKTVFDLVKGKTNNFLSFSKFLALKKPKNASKNHSTLLYRELKVVSWLLGKTVLATNSKIHKDICKIKLHSAVLDRYHKLNLKTAVIIYYYS